jgi:hypothetical protein
MLGLITTDLYLRDDISVHVMPPHPDHEPFDGNIVDYLMLGLIEHPRSALSTTDVGHVAFAKM